MPKKDSKGLQKRQNQLKKAKKNRTASKPTAASTGSAAQKDFSSKRFVNDLMVRGEAVGKPAKGRLPLQATHVIKRQNPDGEVEVERVRFKAF